MGRGPTLVLLVLTLLFTPVAQARCFGVPVDEPTVPWYVHLEISTSSGHTDEVEFGVAQGLSDGYEQGVDAYVLLDAEAPLQAYFLYPDVPDPFSTLSKSFTGFADVASWLLQIQYTGETAEIRVEWDIELTMEIPDEIGLRIITFLGNEVNMKSTGEVTFEADTGAYNFRIIASEQEGGELILVAALLVYGLAAAALIFFLRRKRK